jgi:hypothetical protein
MVRPNDDQQSDDASDAAPGDRIHSGSGYGEPVSDRIHSGSGYGDVDPLDTEGENGRQPRTPDEQDEDLSFEANDQDRFSRGSDNPRS